MDRLGYRQITTTQQHLGSLPDAGERALKAFEAVRSRRHSMDDSLTLTNRRFP